MTNTITTKQVNYIIKLNPSIDVKTIENLTTIEASKLIRKLLKETPKQEAAKLPTFEELKAKYNLGVELDSEQRFYSGNNNNNDAIKKLQDKHDKARKHSYVYSIARELKQILKNEFDIIASVKTGYATYTPEIKVTIKAPLNELKKPFEELSIEELNKYISKLWNSTPFCYNKVYLQPRDPRVKELYNLEATSWGYSLNEKYALAKKFVEKYLKSFNYDHTGANTGDCDYIDCDFFAFVKVEANDIDETEMDNQSYDLMQQIVREAKNA
mgnify:CR=1 FL=1